MNRYLAKLVFTINVDEGKNKSQFDEQSWIIESLTMEEAFEKARQKGKKEETSFLNNNNVRISWEFVDVSCLYVLDNFNEQGPLYSTTYEDQDPDSFIDTIRNKAMIIQTFFPSFA